MPHIHKTLIIPARIMATSQSMPSGAGRWGRTNFALRSSTKFVLLRQGPVPHPWSQPQSNRTKTGRRLESGSRPDLLPLLFAGVGVSGVPKHPAPALLHALFTGVRGREILRSSCRLGSRCAIGDMSLLASRTRRLLLHPQVRRLRYSPWPRPVAQAKGLYLSFQELCLDESLCPVRGLLAPYRPNHPTHPVARDLLPCQVHAEFFCEVLGHERAYTRPALVRAASRERRRRHELRVLGEELRHGLEVFAPPGLFEGERGEELFGPGFAMGHQVLYETRVPIQLRRCAQ